MSLCFSPSFEHLDKEKQPVGGGWKGHRWVFCRVWAVNCHLKLLPLELQLIFSRGASPSPTWELPCSHLGGDLGSAMAGISATWKKSQFLHLCNGKVCISNTHLEHSFPSGCAAFCKALRETCVFFVNIKERAGTKAPNSSLIFDCCRKKQEKIWDAIP